MSERIDEITTLIDTEKKKSVTHSWYSAMVAVLEQLPEFAERKWIPCSERMPIHDQAIYYSAPNGSMYAMFFRTTEGLHSKGYWMPRIMPAPLVMESELVKGLRDLRSYHHGTIGREIKLTHGEAIVILDKAIELANKEGAK